MTWFVETPQVLEEEYSSLRKHGFEFQVNEHEMKQGRLILELEYPLEGEMFSMRCVYPSAYPLFMPMVICEYFPPGRHLNPTDKTLCLLNQPESHWSPRDTLASLLTAQVPILFKEHSDSAYRHESDIKEGYQISGQMLYQEGSVIFVDNFEIPEGINKGQAQISAPDGYQIDMPFRGVLSELSWDKSSQLKNSTPIVRMFNSKLKTRWVKLDATPASTNKDDLLALAIEVDPSLKIPSYKNIKKSNDKFDIVCIAFPEETRDRGLGINWVFILRTYKYLVKRQTYLLRSDFYTKSNLGARIPRTHGIDEKSVLLIGAGALGSNVAWQLARTGIGNITIVDYDILQAGNLVRWLPATGLISTHKCQAIKYFIEMNYLNVKCQIENIRIGSVDRSGENSEERLKHLISEADLVIDCSAETMVNCFISTLCLGKQTDFLWSTATAGGWGGIVGKVEYENKQGSWLDFSHMYSSSKIAAPAAELEAENVQPVGCFSPTFTGTGFDLDNVSNMASRLAVSLLLKNVDGAYPKFSWDVAVLDLWDMQTHEPIAAKWSTYNIIKGYR